MFEDALFCGRVSKNNTYHNFLIVMMLLLTIGGVMGIFLFFQTGNILHTMFGALYVIICIMVITDKGLEKKILGD